MPLYTTNLVFLKSNPTQPHQDNIRPTFTLGLTLAANNKNTIIRNALAIYRTTLALGISPPKLNSFYNIKF